MTKIFINCDNINETQLINNFLLGLNYQVNIFENSQELFNNLQNTKDFIDLIILTANTQNLAICKKIRNNLLLKRIAIIIIVDLLQDPILLNDFIEYVDEFIFQPINYVVINYQIHILLKRNQSQQKIEQKFRSIFDTAVDAIIVIDQDGIIQLVNQATVKLFGYSEKELLENTVNILVPEPWSSQHNQYIKNYLQTGKSKIIGIGREVNCLHRDGHIFIMHLAVSQLPIKVNNKFLFTGILHDISQRILIENQLRQQRDYMEEERLIIQDILYRMHRTANFEKVGLQILNKPLEKISGDLLLSSSRNNGVRHIFLGDFTGHGLSAALAGPIVTDIFYSMTKKGFAPDQILLEINQKINEKLFK